MLRMVGFNRIQLVVCHCLPLPLQVQAAEHDEAAAQAACMHAAGQVSSAEVALDALQDAGQLQGLLQEARKALQASWG